MQNLWGKRKSIEIKAVCCFFFYSSLVFIYLLTLTSIQIISSFSIIKNGQNENKLDDIQRSASLLSSDLSSIEKQESDPECLPKNLFSNMFDRYRRASISRPYFHHWRRARDNNRYPSKSLLAFSPRLGKRAYENDQQLEKENDFNDIDAFLIGYLLGKNIDIIYEDPTKICLSKSVSNGPI
ncbi:unnamed protein product [Rotaria sp. Silwood1]|nr:unnamed protein product [Rotaria sp. Silwood1]